MPEHHDRRIHRQAMHYSTGYTYRTHWEEELLGFAVSCDEVKRHAYLYGSYAEYLLDDARHTVADKIARDLEKNLEAPQAMHPKHAASMTTQESMMSAMKQALHHHIPFEPMNDSTFAVAEQRILSARLHWKPSEIALMNSHEHISQSTESMTIRLLDDMRRSLVAVLTGVAAKQRQRGNEAETAAADRIRYDVEDQYLHLDLSDWTAKVDAMHRYLRMYAHYEQTLCAGELSPMCELSDDA